MIIENVAEIAVSTLVQQIENHVRASRTSEALALCTHILYYFPKHLETYSLMAQALKDQGNLTAALDVYRRVLSADPENLGAYTGLARIFDIRRQAQEALWHTERAFELAPAQPEIRQELLRLYGQSEAVPRERLKLTRGALARLYAQEGLYDRAIHEFRAIGSTTASRYDIRVALAEALWRAGSTRDAADEAQSLLQVLPYCLKANLILGTAWQESAIPESQEYLERASSVDPSNQVAHNLLGARSTLRVTSVTVPEYVPGAPPPSAAQIETPTVPLIPLAPLTEADKALTIFDEPMPASTVESGLQPIEVSSSTPDAIVETQQAEMLEKVESASTPPSFVPQPEPKPTILKDQLPPWLHGEDRLPAESAAVDTRPAETSPRVGSSSPDWLAQLRRNFSAEAQEEKGIPAESIPLPVAAEPKPQSEPELEPPPTTIEESASHKPAAETSGPALGTDLPSWLSEKSETAEPRTEAVHIPTWLTEPTSSLAETTADGSDAIQTSESSPLPPLTSSETIANENELVQPAPASSQQAPLSYDRTAETTESVEAAKSSESMPASADATDSSNGIAPNTAQTPAQPSMEKSPLRVPKWVEVLSRREPEGATSQEEPPARSESAAPSAEIVEPTPPSETEPVPPVGQIPIGQPAVGSESGAPRSQIERPGSFATSETYTSRIDSAEGQKAAGTGPVTSALPALEYTPAATLERDVSAKQVVELGSTSESELSAPAREIAQLTPTPQSESVVSSSQIDKLTPDASSQPVDYTVPEHELGTLSFQPEPALPVADYSKPTTPRLAESSVPPQDAGSESPTAVEAAREELARSRISREPKYYLRLAQAREYRNADRVGEALHEYEYVITKSPRLVPEVIMDLESLVSSGDAPLDAHRLLGDAYTRAGRLNDALERYRYVKRQAESSP